ncbi:MAG TPA: hypothetical protein VM869_26105, partial [Enhygromyxa sp.]|nr:hypothetical protein [Enhygromyxa sp.]
MSSLLPLRSIHYFALPFALALTSIACASDPATSEGDGASETGDGDGDGDPGDGDGDGDGESGDGDGEPSEGLTYWKDAKAILDARCVTCHVAGGIGPFALESWDQVEPFAPIIAPAIADLSMPPWPPNAECNSYEDERS